MKDYNLYISKISSTLEKNKASEAKYTQDDCKPWPMQIATTATFSDLIQSMKGYACLNQFVS